jgi:hypothetical protein
MGSKYDPIFADNVGDYQYKWAVNTIYPVGQRILDEQTKETYTCIKQHTSSPTGTFANDRDKLYIGYWQLYRGEPINFDFEFAWADFDKRDITKIMKTLNIDAKGTAHFTVQMYLDYFYKHKLTGERVPALSMDMVGGDEGAFGVATQHYGTGRMAIRQRPWPFQARGRLFKLRVFGKSVEALRFIAFIFSYKLTGRVR